MIVDGTLQTNDKTWIGLRVHSFLVFEGEELKGYDYSVEVVSIDVFEDGGAHYCPFFDVVKHQTADGRAESTLHIVAADHRADSLTNRLSTSRTLHIFLDGSLAKVLSRHELYIILPHNLNLDIPL